MEEPVVAVAMRLLRVMSVGGGGVGGEAGVGGGDEVAEGDERGGWSDGDGRGGGGNGVVSCCGAGEGCGYGVGSGGRARRGGGVAADARDGLAVEEGGGSDGRVELPWRDGEDEGGALGGEVGLVAGVGGSDVVLAGGQGEGGEGGDVGGECGG